MYLYRALVLQCYVLTILILWYCFEPSLGLLEFIKQIHFMIYRVAKVDSIPPSPLRTGDTRSLGKRLNIFDREGKSKGKAEIPYTYSNMAIWVSSTIQLHLLES